MLPIGCMITLIVALGLTGAVGVKVACRLERCAEVGAAGAGPIDGSALLLGMVAPELAGAIALDPPPG